MAKPTIKSVVKADVRTRLQDFVDSPTYREDVIWRPGVVALLNAASPMWMDWFVPQTAALTAHSATPVTSSRRHTSVEATNGHSVGVHSSEIEQVTSLGLNPMICPGTEDECMIDLTRLYRVSDNVSRKARRRLERVLRRYIRGMDRVARKEGRGKVDLRVRVNLTEQGPRLAFGLASEYPGTQL